MKGMCKVHKNGGQSRSSEVVVGSERIDSETEFVILASTGVWEVIMTLTFHLSCM